MQLAKPHILNFFNRTHRFAAQGNGKEFLFHEIDGESKNYKPIIEHAFIVCKLSSNVRAPVLNRDFLNGEFIRGFCYCKRNICFLAEREIPIE